MIEYFKRETKKSSKKKKESENTSSCRKFIITVFTNSLYFNITTHFLEIR